MNVANIFIENPIWECIYKLFMKKAFNCFCDYCGKNFTKTFKLKKHMQIIHESHKTLNWNYKLQLIMKIKRFNCHQCGKIFARVCNLKILKKYLWNWFMNLIVNTVTKISSKHLICKDINNLFMNLTKYWLEITNYRCSWKISTWYYIKKWCWHRKKVITNLSNITSKRSQ